jgi:hypothetical protein
MHRMTLFLIVSMSAMISCSLIEALLPQEDSGQTPESSPFAMTENPTQPPPPTEIIPTPVTQVTEVPPIGSVTRELDVVEKGAIEAMLEVLIGTHPLFSGESLKVSNGGEGLLDFGDNVRLRLFNDTLLGQIRLESAPGTPLDVCMFLENGGFTGEVTEIGGQVLVETPNGAEIIVLGTDFFIIHDPNLAVTAAGNFSGEIDIAAGSDSIPVPEGTFRWVGIDQRISPALPFPFNKDIFEDQSRQANSPLTAFAISMREIGLEPPEILSVTTNPETILIGSECPDNPGTTFVEVDTLSRGGLIQVVVDWFQGELTGQVILQTEDGEFYTGEIGPFEQFVAVELRVTATDFIGAVGQSEPVFVEVLACIG